MSNSQVLLIAVGLCVGAGVLIALLQSRYGADRDAELSVERIKSALTQLQIAPYGAVPSDGGDPRYARQENRYARQEMRGGEREIDRLVEDLEAGSPPPELASVKALLQQNYALLNEIYELGSTTGIGPRADRLGFRAGRLAGRLDRSLDAVGAEYHDRALESRDQALAGSSVLVILLLGAFAFFLVRSGRLQSEKEGLLEASRKEALTDALTGLGNRRALIEDLDRLIPQAGADNEFILAIFDLDGFKQYNDSFGHPAGDALLARFGGRLSELLRPGVTAYRMGGDEFCMVAELASNGAELVAQASERLAESGEAFRIGCSYGTVVVPTEAETPSDALRISDARMYRVKAARGSATRESIGVLLQVLEERNGDLVDHLNFVADLATATARELGLDEVQVARVQAAARLHDIGKCAVPQTILDKAGDLDESEWAFVRQHTTIGARIAQAAPSLASAAEFIRSTHERYDGSGYPDGLEGESIPLGARIIAVCDAYDAMTSTRPYSPALPSSEALAELEKCSGTQFDPVVVEAFLQVVDRPRAAPV